LINSRRRQAQTIIEYVVLIITIAAAFLAMNTYVQRALNDRFHSMEQEMSPGIIVERVGSAPPVTLNSGRIPIPPGLPVPPIPGWEFDGRTREYCHVASGKCYSEEWMIQQQRAGAIVAPSAGADIDAGESLWAPGDSGAGRSIE